MRYDCLQELTRNSASSRRFLLSLPVRDQELIHDMFNDSIHSAEDLHRVAGLLDSYKRQMQISSSIDYLVGPPSVDLDIR